MRRDGPRTLYDKICDAHTVRELDASHVLLYVDRHILNEYTSPQAFASLRAAGRRAWRPEASLAIVDHVNPTTPQRTAEFSDPEAASQVAFFRRNCLEFGVELIDILDPRQGIEHVVVPEQGLVQPGSIIVCGDSHTTTYGAYGALGFGVGTSDVEHVLATQTLIYRRLQNMRVSVQGSLGSGITAKDLILDIIGRIGASGATECAIEFVGQAINSLDLAGRMTVCNMAVEAGARGALIAPDAKVFADMQARPRSPKAALWQQAMAAWSELRSDPDAGFDREICVTADNVVPLVTWGTSPEQVVPVDGQVPDPAREANPVRRQSMIRALEYMGLSPNDRIQEVRIDHAFVGSCTNSRISDLRSAAEIVRGRRVADGVRAIVVPGSGEVRRQAESEGLDRVFTDAGFEWRQPGCSMCLAMNDDVLPPGARCASSTNRNFEGRQGRDSRTHLMSPAMVAAAAIAGHLADVRTFVGSARS